MKELISWPEDVDEWPLHGGLPGLLSCLNESLDTTAETLCEATSMLSLVLDDNPDSLPPIALDAYMDVVEADFITNALRRTGGNRTEAAEILGIPRSTLQEKMRRLTARGMFDEKDSLSHERMTLERSRLRACLLRLEYLLSE